MIKKFIGKSAILSICLFLCSFFLTQTTVSAQEVNRENNLDEGPYPFYRLVTTSALRGYQLLIAPSREGMFCPMYPSCSNYALQSFNTYSPFKAFGMTVDRLTRCGHDLTNYEAIEVPQGVRFYDSPLKETAININYTSNTSNEYLKSAGIQTSSPVNTSTEAPQHDVQLLFDFAANLEATGDYERANTEYQRLIFYYPDSSLVSQAQVAVARCYYKVQHYLSAINWGESYLDKLADTHQGYELEYYIGSSYFKLSNYSKAIKYYQLINQTTDEDLREKSMILQGLALASEDKWNDAVTVLKEIPSTSKYITNVNKCIKLSQDGNLLKPKNPRMASLLAIIPGLGYFYDGYNQSALSAFIVNVLFMSCTYNAFHQNNTALGVTSGILSFGWYAGNIYGSGITATRKNREMKQELLNQFELGFDF